MPNIDQNEHKRRNHPRKKNYLRQVRFASGSYYSALSFEKQITFKLFQKK